MHDYFSLPVSVDDSLWRLFQLSLHMISDGITAGVNLLAQTYALLLFELLLERVSQLSQWKDIRRIEENINELIPKVDIKHPGERKEIEREREKTIKPHRHTG